MAILYILLSMALLCFLTAIELLSGPFKMSTRLVNFQAWTLYLGSTVLILPIVHIAVPASLVGQAPRWVTIVLFFFVMDLGEYLFHRAQHAIPILWRMHSFHHSDEDMNATTSNRHFWAEPVIKSVTIWPAAALLVHPSPAALTVYFWVSFWHYVCHSKIDFHLGRWSWLLNTPGYHRRHHSTLPEHYNSNFAALFPIFDVISGTYRPPDGFPPTGLSEQAQTTADILLWPLRSRRVAKAP